MKAVLLLPLLLLGCQPLQLPPEGAFQSIARGEGCLPELYYGIRAFHDARFPQDRFSRVSQVVIERRLRPDDQESEATLETWTVESASRRLYRYTLSIGITRAARVETSLRVRIMAIDGPTQP
ncbi:MAG: hypothetical protein HXX12_03635 [Geothrix sp.]|uniref:hypothetical protein n=1 Tax=Geothrix sp. TaxID=1962974 RepID=UPI0017B0A0CC|nr:hypothetical protein [Geothrix sp.]NWJ40048.1 hypothetical protein [Geothrix sp.]WIL21943.1 MAG: hypothetical protein QOZ81_001223 [Geothrix sp.]